MDPLDEMENLASRLETVAVNGCQAPPVPNNGQGYSSSTDVVLRIKEQMLNQCFEMTVKLQAGKSKKPISSSDAEKDLPAYVSELEEARTSPFTKTLALQRMQVWHAISEKLEQSDPEAEEIRGLTNRSLDLSYQIKTFQQESRELQDQITDLQKQRLDLRRLTHEIMKEMDELKKKKEHPEVGKYKNILAKGQSHLEKYQKIATIAQNVLRGVIIASKVNWRDDPKLRDITMELEDLPISED